MSVCGRVSGTLFALAVGLMGCSKSKQDMLSGAGGTGDTSGATAAGASGASTAGATTIASAGRAAGTSGTSASASAGMSGAKGGSGTTGASGKSGMSGASVSAGAGGGALGSVGAAGMVASGDCTRDLLRGTIDKYFAALAAHDASMLPKSATLKFTENSKSTMLGEGLVWKSAGMVKFTRSLLDTERCGSVTEAVIPNSSMDTIYGVRLKLDAQQITEIETIVVDPVNGFPGPPMPAGIINSKSDAWEDLVPADQRSTREQLEAAGKAYFDSFGDSTVKPPYGMPCDRLENGLKTTFGDCGNLGGAMGIHQPAQRYPLSDLEAGITAGFVLFAGGDIDFHIFKVIGGKIRWINAVVGPAETSQGWP